LQDNFLRFSVDGCKVLPDLDLRTVNHQPENNRRKLSSIFLPIAKIDGRAANYRERGHTMITQAFEREIQKVSARMESTAIANVRAMITLGMKPTKAIYYRGGPVVTTVAVHPSWRVGELWSRIETVSASLPEDQTMKGRIRCELQWLADTGKNSEQAVGAARRAAEWLSAGGLCRYSNEDFDVLNGLVEARTCDYVK
jgi:hypothetical protein